jgi:hypothetical protein
MRSAQFLKIVVMPCKKFYNTRQTTNQEGLSMFNDNPKQTTATPFPRRLSVSLKFSELEPELSLFIQATLNDDEKLLEVATSALMKTIANKGGLFASVAQVVSPKVGSSNE